MSTRMITEPISANEAAVLRTIRTMIHEIINDQFESIIETSAINIEDHRSEIEEMIREYITYNVSVTLDC